MERMTKCWFCGTEYTYTTYSDEIGEVERHEFCPNCGYFCEFSYSIPQTNRQILEELQQYRDQLDSGELVRVVHGEWKLISESTGKFETVIEEECSVCGRNVVRYSTQPKDVFCPNCGAKMDGKPKE